MASGPGSAAPFAPDLYQYDLAIRRGEHTEQVRLPEPVVPERVRPLLYRLLARTVPAYHDPGAATSY